MASKPARSKVVLPVLFKTTIFNSLPVLLTVRDITNWLGLNWDLATGGTIKNLITWLRICALYDLNCGGSAAAIKDGSN